MEFSADTTLLGVVCLVFALGILCGFIHDLRVWNGGYCKQSGKPWRRFDTDSQGGRGYSDGEGHYCWISWPVGDRT